MTVVTRLASITVSAAVTLAAFGVAAYADDAPTTDPCAQQQAQVDRAQGALARVNAVFAGQQEDVEKAREVADEAAAGQERAAAKLALHQAKQAKDATKVTQRAQQQRLVKATERLTACQLPATEAPATA